MAARERIPKTLSSEKRLLEISRHPELLEAKIAAQASEITKLVADNKRLVSSLAVLKEELATALQESQRLKAHTRSLQTESEIQIRVLAEKIARSEAIVRAGEGARAELQNAIKEAQGFVADRHELTAKIQGVNMELRKARDDIKSLPGLRSELESFRKEHQRLRLTFEYEKGANEEEVEELKAMEQKLILMAEEAEKVRISISNAEKIASASHPYSSTKSVAPVTHHLTGIWASERERTNPNGISRTEREASASISGGEGKCEVTDTHG